MDKTSLVQATRDFEAALTGKAAAGFEGPFKSISDSAAEVWLAMDSYGRVHHVVADLTAGEKVLERYKAILVGAQNDLGTQGIYFRSGPDIYVDGLPGGRNRMVMSFYVAPARGGWTEEQQDAISDLLRLGEKKKPA